MAINYTLLFGRIRVCIDALESLDTQNTSQAASSVSILAEWSGTAEDFENLSSTLSSLESLSNSWFSKSSIVSLIGDEILRHIVAEEPTFSGTVDEAIDKLADYMRTDGENVLDNTASVTASSPAGATKPKLIATLAGASVVTNSERVVPESAVISISSGSINFKTEDQILGEDPAWPGGSGANLSVIPSAESGLISNGNFDSESDFTNFPDGWEIGVGTVGTSILQTAFATKTITITGTPTSGWYAINLTDLSSNLFQTEPLSFDAEESAVQSAIQAIPRFGEVTVASSGTGPNYVHTITFKGIAGTPAAITIKNQTNGTVTPADGAAVDSSGLSSLAMKWVGQAVAELTAIRQRVSLEANTVYAFFARVRRSAATTGQLRIRMVDGAHAVINDNAGSPNQVTQDVSTVATASYDWMTGFFRTPEVLPTVVKVEVAMTTGLSNTGILYFERLSLDQPLEFGDKGVLLAAMASTADAVDGDAYTLSTANNFAGRIQTRMARHFNKQLPSDGAPTIAD